MIVYCDSSALLKRIIDEAGAADTRVALQDIAILEKSKVVLRSAADIPARYVRSMDAIHVASAFHDPGRSCPHERPSDARGLR